ncbi:hypothetical protein [Roseateles aquatilis]|uniref:hypothetical protein n=1 Tax=Roseateles aquatilis TaxID=431061 RepID=UPI0011326BDE|nr:hypothetical protein [Roseateles aquatilis]
MKSTKKRKKNRAGPRSDCLVFSATADENGSILVDWSGQKVLVNGVPAQDVRVERTYPRVDKGAKVVSSFNFGANNPEVTGYTSQWSPHRAALQRFDSLVSVDTNTRLIKGVWVSVTAAWATESGWRGGGNEGGINLNLQCLFLELHASAPLDPEGRGWYSVLNFGLEQNQDRSSDRLIGVIVDSKLGDHGKINDRSLGYFSNFLLPQEFSLVYASDQSADSIVNTMIRLCDKSAGDILAAVEAGEVDISNLTPPILLKIQQM